MKTTRATFKKFIKINKDNLFVYFKTSFDGMVDCVTSVKSVPHKAQFGDDHVEHTMGIKGVWLVGSSRDYFKSYEDEIFKGIEVSNSCGSFAIATLK